MAGSENPIVGPLSFQVHKGVPVNG